MESYTRHEAEMSRLPHEKSKPWPELEAPVIQEQGTCLNVWTIAITEGQLSPEPSYFSITSLWSSRMHLIK